MHRENNLSEEQQKFLEDTDYHLDYEKKYLYGSYVAERLDISEKH